MSKRSNKSDEFNYPPVIASKYDYIINFLREFDDSTEFRREEIFDAVLAFQDWRLAPAGDAWSLWENITLQCVKCSMRFLQDQDPFFNELSGSTVALANLITENKLWIYERALILCRIIEDLSLRLISGDSFDVSKVFKPHVKKLPGNLTKKNYVKHMRKLHEDCLNIHFPSITVRGNFPSPLSLNIGWIVFSYSWDALAFAKLAESAFYLVYFKFSIETLYLYEDKEPEYLDSLDELLDTCIACVKECPDPFLGSDFKIKPPEVNPYPNKRPRPEPEIFNESATKRTRS